MDPADRLLDALRTEGLRITQARRAVCGVLATAPGEHLSAADILERARVHGAIDQSTVYRTLETLELSGLITHTHIGHGALVYHLADEPPHQHLVCVRCDATAAVPESELTSFFARLGETTGYVLDPTHVALSGLCPDCAATEAPPAI